MYAIIRAGGKQYKVNPGQVLRVEKMPGELGSEMELTEVLFVGGDKSFVGQPTLENAKVTVVVTNQAKAPKVIVFKKKRRQGYRRMRGHRQLYTELFIKAITSPEGQTVEAESAPKVFDPAKREERLKLQAEARKEAKSKKDDAPVSKAVKKKAPASVQKKKTKKKTAVKKKTAAKKTAKKSVTKKKAATTKKASKKA